MDVRMPDGTVITNVPDGTTRSQLMARVQKMQAPDTPITPVQVTPAAALPRQGEQPSFIDRVVASPVGRFVQENVVSPALSAVASIPEMQGKAQSFGGALPNPISRLNETIGEKLRSAADAEQEAYQASLQRNRNTPGYLAARAEADQMQGNAGAATGAFMPTLQGPIAGTVGLIGGLDQSNAMADAAEAQQAQFSQDHPFLSGALSMVGGLAAGAPAKTAGAPLPAKAQPAPSVSALRSEAAKQYAIVDNSGLTVSAPAVDQMVNDITSDIAKRGFHPMLHPKSAAVVSALGDATGDQSIQQMEILRRIAKEGAKSPDKADRAMARVVQDHIDDFMENLSPQQLSSAPDPQAQEALKTARDLWTKASRGEVIEDALEKAKNAAGANYTQAGYATAVRQRFRQIANNDRAMARFSPEQRAQIKAVARGGKTENVLRLVGKLAVRGPVSGTVSMGGGLAAFGPAGAIALPAVGEAAKAGSTAITLRNARRASELMRGGVIPGPALLPPQLAPNIPVPGLLAEAAAALTNRQREQERGLLPGF